jgi:hypothetical protein
MMLRARAGSLPGRAILGELVGAQDVRAPPPARSAAVLPRWRARRLQVTELDRVVDVEGLDAARATPPTAASPLSLRQPCAHVPPSVPGGGSLQGGRGRRRRPLGAREGHERPLLHAASRRE